MKNKQIAITFLILAIPAYFSCSSAGKISTQKPGPLSLSLIHEEAIVKDSQTGLVWVNSKNACYLHRIGPVSISDTPQKAIDHYSNLTFAGNSEWRLPTDAELSDFVIKTKSQNLQLAYIFEGCKTIIAANGKFVKTEKSDEAGIIEDMIAGGAGVRCVNDKIN